MEENQNIYLSGSDLVLFSIDRTGQNDQESKVELYSSDESFVTVLLWEVAVGQEHRTLFASAPTRMS